MRAFFTLISIVPLLSSCIIQSSQLNSLLELIGEPTTDLYDKRWIIRYDNYESVVYAVSTPEGTLFSNNIGDQALFDGWLIRNVQGMGLHRLSLSIYDETNSRIFKRGNRTVTRHICDEWQQQERNKVVRFTQYCSNEQGYNNSILLDNSGDISVIRQIVDERYTALMLTKLN